MRLSRLILAAFGRFRGLELELVGGLNVIYGPNEAGKTTVHKFIEGMLFGFKRPYLKRRQPAPELGRFRPWAGTEYRGVLEYEHEGRKYRIERSFEPDETRILDADTGAEITASFRQDSTREYDFAARHLGLNKTAFINTISISQMGSRSRRELAAEVRSRLANLAGSGAEDLSVRGALASLEKAAEAVGTRGRSGSRLGALASRVEKLEMEEREALDLLQEIKGHEVELAEVRRELENLEREHAALEQEVCNARAALRRQLLEGARRKAEEIASLQARVRELERWSEFPAGERDRVSRLDQELEQVKSEITRWEEEKRLYTAQLAEAREFLEARAGFRGMGEKEAAEIGTAYQLYLHGEAEGASLDSQLREARSRLEKARKELQLFAPLAGFPFDPLEKAVELDARARDLGQSEARRRAAVVRDRRDSLAREVARGNPQLRTAAVLLAAVVALLVLLPGYRLSLSLLLALPLAVCWIGWRQQVASRVRLRQVEGELLTLEAEERRLEAEAEEHRQALQRLLQAAGATDIPTLKDRVIGHRRLLQEARYQEENVKRLEEELRERETERGQLVERITSLLARAGLGEARDPLTGGKVEAFQQGVRDYLDRERVARRLEQQIAEAEDRRREVLARREELEVSLGEILQRAGAGTAEEFLQGCDKHLAYRETAGELRRAEESLAQMLGPGNLDELEAEVAGLPVPEGWERVTAAQVEELEARCRSLEVRREELRGKRLEVENTIRVMSRERRPLPDIREDLARERSRLWQLEGQVEALSLARSVIEELSQQIQQDFAPRLQREVREQVGRLTGGRYRDLRIDENLEVRVVAPETATMVSLEQLSAGTVDQFYFALRVAVADLVSGRKVPVILDDSFVQFDDERLVYALRSLDELARERQILLFTCHRREIETLSAEGIPFRAITLE